MVSYDPERSVKLNRESNKTFGGFNLSLSDWQEVEFTTEYLTKSLDDIYPAERPSFYNINSNVVNSNRSPSSIVLLENTSDEEATVIPLFIETKETSIVYRGREMFNTIKREDSPSQRYEKSTVDLQDGREIVSEEYEGSVDYMLYTRESEEPVATIPATYGDPTKVVSTDGQVVASVDDLYFAPDSYLCELCGWTELYLEKTV